MKKVPLSLSISCLLAFLILSLCFSAFQPAFGVTLIGNITISGNDVLPMVDGQFDVRGNIIVEGNGTLFLKDAVLNLDQTAAYQYALIFRNPSGGNPRLVAENATLTSKRWFNVYFEGNSSAKADKFTISFARIHTKGTSQIRLGNFKLRGSVDATESSSVTIYDSTMREPHPEVTGSFEAYGSSVISVSSSTLMNPFAYQSSMVYITNSKIEGTLRAYGSSRVVVTNSTKDWQVRSQDASAVVISASVMRNGSTYTSSVVSILDTTMTGLDARDSSIVSITGSTLHALRAYNQSRITLLRSKVTATTSLEACDSSVVWVRATTMEGLTARKSSTVTIANSTLGSLLYAFDTSKVDMSNSRANVIRTYDSSSVSISKSNAKLAYASGSSKVAMADSNLNELFITGNALDSQMFDLKPRSLRRWNSLTDMSISLGQGGYVPDVTLTRTEVKEGWGFFFSGASNVTIANSVLEHISLFGSSVARLINSTVGSYYITSGSKIYTYWYVDVYAAGGASVIASYSNGTAAESGFADENGLAKLTLLGGLIDDSGISSYGYTIDSSWNGNHQEQAIELTDNETINMVSLPWWQQYWQLLLVGVVAALAVALFLVIRRRRSVPRVVSRASP